jgi:hypothetical protein
MEARGKLIKKVDNQMRRFTRPLAKATRIYTREARDEGDKHTRKHTRKTELLVLWRDDTGRDPEGVRLGRIYEVT